MMVDRTDGDDQQDQSGRGEDGSVERNEFLRKIHQRVSAGERAQDQQQHPAVKVLDGKRVGDQTQHQAEHHHAGRTKPGEFTEAIDGCDAQHVERDGRPKSRRL